MTTPRRNSKPLATITLRAADLADAVKVITPHVATDDTMPMLCGFQLYALGGIAWLGGTDRYTCASFRIPLDGDEPAPDGLSAVIPAATLKLAVRMFPPNRRHSDLDTKLRISITAHHVTIESVTKVTADSTVFSAPLVKLNAPTLTSIFHPTLIAISKAKDRVPKQAVNGEYLARFAAVTKTLGHYGAPLVLRQQPGFKPMIVTAADSFIGAIMPVRLNGDEDDLEAWIKRVTPGTASEAAS
jgi:hypothetical protein